MTTEEAIESFRSRGFYVKAMDRGGFRGGTSRTQEGNIGIVHNGFIVWPQDGKWVMRHVGRGQLSVEHVVDTLDEAVECVEAYIREVARGLEY
jgi:hypothetical protein